MNDKEFGELVRLYLLRWIEVRNLTKRYDSLKQELCELRYPEEITALSDLDETRTRSREIHAASERLWSKLVAAQNNLSDLQENIIENLPVGVHYLQDGYSLMVTADREIVVKGVR